MRQMKNKRIFLAILLITAFLIPAGWLAMRALQTRSSRLAGAGLQSEAVTRGELNVMVQADGVVQADQSAQLLWKTGGTVAQVNVKPGDRVTPGEVLAKLDKASLPQSVILARADLISAQRNLDDLLNSETQRAEAWKAVEDANQALEDARNNDSAQARALQAVAQAQKAVKDAELNLAIVTKKPSQEAIDQAYANLVLAENVLKQTRQQHDKIQRQLNKPERNYEFYESKSLYRSILKPLDLKLATDQRAYEQALEKYNQLLEPIDPLNRMVAEGNLALAQAKLAQAQRDWERIKNGPSPAEIAVLEAQLAEAQREWERWKAGVEPAEISAAKARLAAAEAALKQDHLSAPFDGVVTEVLIHVGDQVASGTPALRIDDLSPLSVIAQVSEIDINQIQEGQTTLLKFDAVPGVEYHGRVTDLPLVGEEVGGGVSFQLKIEIIDADEKVRPAMTTVADIIVSTQTDALLVPNRAIRYPEAKPVVYVQRGGQIIPIEVKLGASSETYSEILEGDLQPGERVLVDLPENFEGRAFNP
jgi:HlyD family secretion protein